LLTFKLKEKKLASQKTQSLPITPAPRDGDLPLSFAQQRLWFLDQLAPNNPFYNISNATMLEGKLDLGVLELVINEIVRRHEVLRTRFEVKAGAPVQVIDEWEPRKLEVVDLIGMTREEREEEAGRIVRGESEVGFDLSRGPLIRLKVLKVAEEEHLLLYTMHHIVSDGWSMEILIREIGTLYQAYSANEKSPLPDLEIQYADYAVWQRNWLQGAALERQLSYWQERLAGIEELELPIDHPRPAVRSHRGSRQYFVVEWELTRKLRDLSQQEEASLFMTLLGGFDIVMSRYSGQEDVALGTDIANRNRAEIEGLIGFFVNQLVLRVEVRARESFRELLKRVRGVCLGAYAHQDAPFEKLVEELQPERDLGKSPLFQAKLIWQNAPREGLKLEGVRLNDSDRVQTAGETPTARGDLKVAITDVGHELVGAVTYSRDLFEEETIKRLMRHYINVLRRIVEGGERPICELSLFDDQEREQILVEWNETRKPYPDDRRVHELFAEQAERTPDRMALVCDGQGLSYRELDRRANQLARYLQGLGVGPEVAVGLCLERSLEMVMALLGVLKAGGAYLPLDPEAPLERVALMLEDAGVGVVLTQRRLEERLPSFWGQTICLDVEWERISQESESEPESEVVVGNPVYVIYTSGSTGRPKGVVIQHRSLANYTHHMCQRLGVAEVGSEGLQFATVSTITADLGNTCIYPSLLSGGCLHILSYQVATDGIRFEEYLKWNPIDVLKIVPSHLGALLGSQPNVGKRHPEKYLIFGGEALSYELVERIRERGAKCEVINHYGPTETTIGSLTASVSMKIEQEKERRGGTAPIGRPISNTEIYILGRELEPAPVGARGELYIAGVGVAREYRGGPDLTAERFIPNLFSQEGGERLYRTGDVCRYLSDGKIEFIGRADNQVKIRGYRIELGEIEAVLDEHGSVKQSVVVVSEDENGDRRLIAYVVGAEVTTVELQKYLKERLPEYMTPSAIVALEKMPLTPNGKLNRRALPAPDGAPYNAREYEAPVGATETAIARLWAELLKVERVGRYDHFFELGGHSLLAVSLIERMRREGLHCDVRALFATPTLTEFAAATEEMEVIL
jgi:amino acid adenylation domain-containing protein